MHDEFFHTALSESRSAGRYLYKFFSWIHRSWLARKIFVGVIFFILLLLISPCLPPDETQIAALGLRPPFNIYIPVLFKASVVFLIAIGLHTIPILLLSHWDQQRQHLLIAVMSKLNLIAEQINKFASDSEILKDADKAMDALIDSCKHGGKNCIITPTAFYLRADIWLDRLKDDLDNKPEILATIKKMADKAPHFRAALDSQFLGNLRLILPDPKDPIVKDFFRERSRKLGFADEDILLEVVSDAVTWAQGDLKRRRNDLKKTKRNPGIKTSIHLTNASPNFRFMMVNDLCFIQAFPRESGGFGITQHIALIRREHHHISFAAIECGLDSIGAMF